MSVFGRKHAQRGRPKKKPGYGKETKIAELVTLAVALYQMPYDDRDERPEEAPTLLSVAEVLNTTSSKVRKLLITADFFSLEKSRRINSLFDQG